MDLASYIKASYMMSNVQYQRCMEIETKGKATWEPTW
jgi:hypothetical protein